MCVSERVGQKCIWTLDLKLTYLIQTTYIIVHLHLSVCVCGHVLPHVSVYLLVCISTVYERVSMRASLCQCIHVFVYVDRERKKKKADIKKETESNIWME